MVGAHRRSIGGLASCFSEECDNDPSISDRLKFVQKFVRHTRTDRFTRAPRHYSVRSTHPTTNLAKKQPPHGEPLVVPSRATINCPSGASSCDARLQRAIHCAASRAPLLKNPHALPLISQHKTHSFLTFAELLLPFAMRPLPLFLSVLFSSRRNPIPLKIHLKIPPSSEAVNEN